MPTSERERLERERERGRERTFLDNQQAIESRQDNSTTPCRVTPSPGESKILERKSDREREREREREKEREREVVLPIKRAKF